MATLEPHVSGTAQVAIPVPRVTETPSPAPAYPLAPLGNFIKGVAYTAWSVNDYNTPGSDHTLTDVIRPLGVTWIELLTTCLQDTPRSTQINCGASEGTPSDDAMRHAIQTAHALGIRVMVKPHVDLAHPAAGQWRGDIGFGSDEAAWKAWFESYAQVITHYAALAQEMDADAFNVGTELTGTSQREKDWRGVIAAVRTVFKGPLVYGANWGEEDQVQWWDAVDFIGVDAYYPLTQSFNPTIDQLEAAWKPQVTHLGNLSKKWNKPIIFTEIGYRSIDGANTAPWDYQVSAKIDLQEQADCYTAVYKAFSDQSWWHGIFWWNWTPNPSQGGPADRDYTASGKPAEDVLRQIYGAPPRPSPTPTPALSEDPANSLVIYADALAPGWEDWSWDASLDFAAQKTVFQGTAAIQVSLKAWGALSLHNTGVGAAGYTWFEFFINPGSSPDRQLGLYIVGADEQVPPGYLWVKINDPRYLEGGSLQANRWTRVRIPLSDLAEKYDIITRFALQDQSGSGQSEFYVDNFRLVGAAR